MELARATVTQTVQNARDDGWQRPDASQVGFDFDQWERNVFPIEVLSSTHVAIFDIQKMGTAEDFEQIAQSPKSVGREEMLWHTGRRMGDSFRRLIFENAWARRDLAEARQAVWGTKTPQWWLLEYGNDYPGAYPSRLGTYTIQRTGYQMADEAEEIISRYVNAYLRREGLLV